MHRILALETWVFGEAFAVAVDDRSLAEALRRHVEILGREELADEREVLGEDGKRQILDLMLARAVPQAFNRLEHLVVELKRPSVSIGSEELTQIKKYAFAVANDPRFSTTDVSWNFQVVSTKLDGFARREASQANKPQGLVYDDAKIKVWALEWGQVIEDCRHRMKFVQEQLGYEATEESALTYLRDVHQRFLPDILGGPPKRPKRSGGSAASEVDAPTAIAT